MRHFIDLLDLTAAEITELLNKALTLKAALQRGDRTPYLQGRVLGCMVGVELAVDGAPVVKACLERRLLINCTHTTVLRLLPALTLTDEQLDHGCGILEEVLLGYRAG